MACRQPSMSCRQPSMACRQPSMQQPNALSHRNRQHSCSITGWCTGTLPCIKSTCKRAAACLLNGRSEPRACRRLHRTHAPAGYTALSDGHLPGPRLWAFQQPRGQSQIDHKGTRQHDKSLKSHAGTPDGSWQASNLGNSSSGLPTQMHSDVQQRHAWAPIRDQTPCTQDSKRLTKSGAQPGNRISSHKALKQRHVGHMTLATWS